VYSVFCLNPSSAKVTSAHAVKVKMHFCRKNFVWTLGIAFKIFSTKNLDRKLAHGLFAAYEGFKQECDLSRGIMTTIFNYISCWEINVEAVAGLM